ncbi:class I SAM-dependent methyltransferase [Sphingobacterium bovistauri]|uniref:Class I SAM-dependent methyltransferase n=1 Tax=Sphingobacterium bovistauri TaxID=2781959 RepID=A0ABS7Z8A5_9SPHI|nr:class I SAM-dependent methyltransferase [Sphingobacterium bovistauri]MCA5006380.1 class I SAM-dependent methyltransferase [Sphingobacterium bovistauri]
MTEKYSLNEIEKRFDNDVERFSNLNTGQMTTLDAKFNMELITEGILRTNPNITQVLDIGCGAGNYDVSLLQRKSPLHITLCDLSQPMLDKAKERVEALNNEGSCQIIKGDFRKLSVDDNSFDVIIATAVLHHLRDDTDWENTFAMLYRKLKKGGSIWIFDLITQDSETLQDFIYTQRYGEYLTSLKDEVYRDHVFDYIEKEDSLRSLIYQLDLLREVGFSKVDILHKNLCFASFVGFKE